MMTLDPTGKSVVANLCFAGTREVREYVDPSNHHHLVTVELAAATVG